MGQHLQRTYVRTVSQFHGLLGTTSLSRSVPDRLMIDRIGIECVNPNLAAGDTSVLWINDLSTDYRSSNAVPLVVTRSPEACQ